MATGFRSNQNSHRVVAHQASAAKELQEISHKSTLSRFIENIQSLATQLLDYAQSSATLSACSGQGLHTQTALAIRSVIAAILKRLLKRKQKPPR